VASAVQTVAAALTAAERVAAAGLVVVGTPAAAAA